MNRGVDSPCISVRLYRTHQQRCQPFEALKSAMPEIFAKSIAFLRTKLSTIGLSSCCSRMHSEYLRVSSFIGIFIIPRYTASGNGCTAFDESTQLLWLSKGILHDLRLMFNAQATEAYVVPGCTILLRISFFRASVSCAFPMMSDRSEASQSAGSGNHTAYCERSNRSITVSVIKWVLL